MACMTKAAFWLAMAGGVIGAAPALAADKPPRLRDGAACEKFKDAEVAGETHRCYFEPKAFDRYDFARSGSRETYVLNTLGSRCGEIEILRHGEATEPRLAGTGYIQMSVRCGRR